MMKYKPDATPIKGMVFAGCSFTWGQNLHYYTNSKTVIEDKPYNFNPIFITRAHVAFKDAVRYPRLVANHFNTYEIVHAKNGGSNKKMYEYWSECFSRQNSVLLNPGKPTKYVHAYAYDYFKDSGKETFESHPKWFDKIEYIDTNDISHFILQLTPYNRDTVQLKVGNIQKEITLSLLWNPDGPFRDLYLDWLNLNNKTVGQHNEEVLLNSLASVKTLLQQLEDKNIKTYILTWPNDFLEYIKKDSWFSERFITFDYEGKNYLSMDDLMTVPGFKLSTDTDNFEVPTLDDHPSLKCHRVVADNIIKRIEQDNAK